MANEVLAAHVASAAKAAGLTIVSTTTGTKVAGGTTAKFTIAPASEPSRTLLLELSDDLDLGRPALAEGLKVWFAEAAGRLRGPRPDVLYTLHGLPLSFGKFGWPFHESTSGADTSLVHGEIRLEDGDESVLHALIAVSMTVTFRDVVAAPEQPYAEGFIYNAVRKTMDQGQLELVKSGNRQPVPLTTRYYSSKQNKFIFNDTTPQQRVEFLAGKLYWISGVLGGGAPVWFLDPRDAQYLDCSIDELRAAAKSLLDDGRLQPASDAAFGSPTLKLLEKRDFYVEKLAGALKFIKPTFNESMRAGQTNM